VIIRRSTYIRDQAAIDKALADIRQTLAEEAASGEPVDESWVKDLPELPDDEGVTTVEFVKFEPDKPEAEKQLCPSSEPGLGGSQCSTWNSPEESGKVSLDPSSRPETPVSRRPSLSNDARAKDDVCDYKSQMTIPPAVSSAAVRGPSEAPSAGIGAWELKSMPLGGLSPNLPHGVGARAGFLVVDSQRCRVQNGQSPPNRNTVWLNGQLSNHRYR
jgi:hypothetical protein